MHFALGLQKRTWLYLTTLQVEIVLLLIRRRTGSLSSMSVVRTFDYLF